MAEALALKFGLSLAQRTGCNRIIINSDNMEVIETMNEGGRSSGAATAIFDDCFHLACDFPISRFEHCNRELARFSFISDWFEEPHNAIVPILINDVMIISNE
ncbi:hypothetical protein VPH35_110595 [Triticum aestivum]